MTDLPAPTDSVLLPAGDIETRLYRALYDAIAQRRLLPGAKLPEQQLSDLFGASRSRVRQVLARLAQERYVELRPNRGAFVACPPPREAREVFAARQVLETAVVRALAGHLSAEPEAQLRRHLQAEAQAQQLGHQEEAVRLSGEFHLQLAEQAGNRVLRGLLAGLIVRSSLIIGLYGRPLLPTCAEDEHARLLDELIHGTPQSAEALLAEHFAHILASLDLEVRRDSQADLREALRL